MVLVTPAGSAKIFEFCMATVLANGFMIESTGTKAPRQQWIRGEERGDSTHGGEKVILDVSHP